MEEPELRPAETDALGAASGTQETAQGSCCGDPGHPRFVFVSPRTLPINLRISLKLAWSASCWLEPRNQYCERAWDRAHQG